MTFFAASIRRFDSMFAFAPTGTLKMARSSSEARPIMSGRMKERRDCASGQYEALLESMIRTMSSVRLFWSGVPVSSSRHGTSSAIRSLCFFDSLFLS